MAFRLLGAWVLLLSAAPAATTYDTPQVGFTFTVPAGWEIKTEKTEALPVVYGPKDDPLAPYLVVHELRGGKDLVEVANTAVREAATELNFQLSARDAFLTADKKPGYKYVFLTPTSPAYREAYFFVEGGAGRIFVLIAVVPDDGWKKYAAALDALVSSIRAKSATPAAPATNPTPKPAASPPPKPAAPPITHGGGR